MAKKKTVEGADILEEQAKAPEVANPQENTEVIETEGKGDSVDTETADENKNEGQEDVQDNHENDDETVTTAVTSQESMPAHVLGYLKRHSEIKEAYIDKQGGVFSANTPKVFLKDAVLYQNPFYKQ